MRLPFSMITIAHMKEPKQVQAGPIWVQGGSGWIMHTIHALNPLQISEV
jgi:hypothetical protein